MIVARAFAHLDRMSDEFGVFEHADHSTARREHGYCTDDMARVLVAAVSEDEPRSEVVERLEALAVGFLLEAQGRRGDTRNRRRATGSWENRYETGDCWGRSLWGLGAAAGRSRHAGHRADALVAFDRACRLRSTWPRSMAFAALGASEVTAAEPGHRPALRLLEDAAWLIGRPQHTADWPWPEPRLTYANGVLPAALIAAGQALGRLELTDRGVALLDWLVAHETTDGRLSVTPVGGAGPDDGPARFDQQPIEVAAIADACARAHRATGDDRWADRVLLAEQWFSGTNDVGVPMYDDVAGGGYDGLTERGPNRNQGCESTLALISTLQHARACAGAAP